MSNKRRNRRTAKGSRNTPMGKARAKKRLAANVTEEHDWYLDTPDVRLTRIFTIVLALHAIAFAGIVAFKMVDKASATTGITISSASKNSYRNAVAQEKSVSASAVSAPQAPEVKARPKPAAPLRRTPGVANQYKVQAGQSLSEIASELGVSAEALRGANSIISDNELYPGRWLTIPDKNAVAKPRVGNSNVAKPKPAPAQRTQPRVYEVAPGDTAWGIASKLNVSYKELLSINGVTRPETLQIGQKLKVPSSN